LWDKGYLELAKARVDRVVRQARVFSISGNNKGLWCPFKPIFCQEGYAKNVKYTLIGYKSGEKWQLSVPGAAKRWAESLVSAKQEYLTQFALSVCRSISPVLDRSQNERRKEE